MSATLILDAIKKEAAISNPDIICVVSRSMAGTAVDDQHPRPLPHSAPLR
jgi:hypothetical protein